MPDEVVMFWLIHLFLGLIVPFLALSGCCRRGEEEQQAVDSTNEFMF